MRTSSSNGATLVASVVAQITEDILSGLLAPGERLLVEPLRQRFGVSLSVMRESLSRLSESRLVVSVPQVGFSVAPIDQAGLRELVEYRTEVETLALRWAIERGDVAWESGIVAALHALERTPMASPGGESGTDMLWVRAHSRFHACLAEGCGNALLLQTRASLYDASELYRRWARAPSERLYRDTLSEHRALADAVLSRDVGLAVTRMRDHLEFTAHLVVAPPAAQEGDPSLARLVSAGDYGNRGAGKPP